PLFPLCFPLYISLSRPSLLFSFPWDPPSSLPGTLSGTRHHSPPTTIQFDPHTPHYNTRFEHIAIHIYLPRPRGSL
ncbi:hypothetical protein B0H11DRAFT_1993162, partial [Mycena galericulata]